MKHSKFFFYENTTLVWEQKAAGIKKPTGNFPVGFSIRMLYYLFFL
ncbi:hypothetical protein C874_12435 [Elizabethkingia anophelis 502]|nr:hypothetical protein C874_12435 [Elizabethkingia anophelis 502]